jgi:hypothetical protein
MAEPVQNYKSHARFLPLYHFIVSPIFLINAIVEIKRLFGTPTLAQVWTTVLALGMAGFVVVARTMVLTVQNRVIRLEMRLRLREVLPADLQGKINDLRPGQLIGLRFASDAELPGLVRKVLAGELTTGRAIKQAVTDWQPDFLRA